MNPSRWSATRLSPFLAALLIAGAPAATSAEPNLSTSFGDPAYAFAANCDLAQPLVFINVVVANRGNAPAAETQFSAIDSTNVLQGDVTTVPLAPGTQMTLRIPMRLARSSAGPIAGTHSVTVIAGARRLGPLAVTVPATLCVAPLPAPVTLATAAPAGGAATRAHRAHPGVSATVPPPGVSQVGEARSDTAKILIASRTPAVPANVRNASTAQDCAAHVGLLGALVCPDMIRSGHLLLIWDWQSGSGPDDIDGYRVYRVDGSKRLVYTRANKRDLTLVDVPVPPGGYPGACYAVSAYAGTFESELSRAFCPTRQQTIVLANPIVPAATPKPRAPKHVDIHVTSDSFPMDTIVAAGGDVTWINDDADEHSVYSVGGSIVGDLYPHGGRFTTTFRNLGYNYIVSYLCEYHADMRGRIMVVVNP